MVATMGLPMHVLEREDAVVARRFDGTRTRRYFVE
jgi:hypothetical protein